LNSCVGSSLRLAVLAYEDVRIFIKERDNSFCESYLTQNVTNDKLLIIKYSFYSTKPIPIYLLKLYQKWCSYDFSLYFRKSHSLVRWIWQLTYKFSLHWNFLSIFHISYEFQSIICWQQYRSSSNSPIEIKKYQILTESLAVVSDRHNLLRNDIFCPLNVRYLASTSMAAVNILRLANWYDLRNIFVSFGRQYPSIQSIGSRTSTFHFVLMALLSSEKHTPLSLQGMTRSLAKGICTYLYIFVRIFDNFG
jgi:hypothetical protein